MTEQDIATRRARDLERYHRRTAERRAAGLCLKCGKRPPAPHRSQCEPCIEKRRSADLARHHRQTAERAARGLCPRCGKQPPAPGRSMCEACNEKRNRASRARDARLRAAGIPRRDPERTRAYERERSRREAGQRRAAGLCLHCGKAPALDPRQAPRHGAGAWRRPRRRTHRRAVGRAQRRAPVVCRPDWNRHGRAAPFRRNDELLNLLPRGLIAFPGSGITDNLVEKDLNSHEDGGGFYRLRRLVVHSSALCSSASRSTRAS